MVLLTDIVAVLVPNEAGALKGVSGLNVFFKKNNPFLTLALIIEVNLYSLNIQTFSASP